MKTMFTKNDAGDEYISGEGETILDCLSDARIFYIEKLENGKFKFTENCDEYFDAEMTKDQMKELIRELQELVD